MTATPFGPGAHAGERAIPAADAGRGAPEPEPGFGVEGEDTNAPEQPDTSEQPDEPEKPDEPEAPE
ncbi:hypothetical protein [Amycolatopsis albispora]|uniref:hypothetical protein n=1 Tax=Amycolatopsis albispora TaxID=1804986 RepID=UPI000DE49888|nr:hypothetical protein [Amycolatopsis albispora]